MGKRGNGEGSISRRKDGRWCARYTADGKRGYIYGSTRKEVAEKLAEVLSKRGEGLYFGYEAALKEYLERWLEDSVRDTVRERTWERYEQITKKHLIPELGGIKLKKLTPAHVQGLYRRKLDSGLSPRTVQYVHVTLHKALKQAVRWQLIPRNVTEAVTPPRLRKKEVTPLSPEQVRIFLKAIEGNRLEALYVLAVTTGLRQGELLALRWEDVDLTEGIIRVKRALSMSKGKLEFTAPKSSKGKRGVGLTDKGIGSLKTHKTRQDEERQHWRKDHDLVFPNINGEPRSSRGHLILDLKNILRKASLPEIRFHDLRHTCATLLLSKGIHPKIVQEILGHSTISITLDTYSHVLPTMQEKAVAAMDEIFE